MRRSSYTADALTELLGERAVRGLAHGMVGPVRSALDADGSPLAVLARLLLVGDSVAVDQLAQVVPLDDIGPLLQREGSLVRATHEVAPHADESHDWFVVSDRTDPRGRPIREDHVLGVGGASTTLAQLTVRRPVRRSLDIGTGCGVQSLHLSTHSTSVVATDVVPRALQVAATTFALSGVDVELVGGDLVDPVADREFDLVVCNPPFVVGPRARYASRDAAWSRPVEGDEMSRRAVRAAASVLAPGGVAQLLVNWLHVRGEDWRDRVADWVADLGLDALLLQRDVQDPLDYVATWSADAGENADDDAAVQWRGWFDDNRVEAVGLGWVVLRRGDPPHRIAVEEVVHPVEQPLGEAIADWLDRLAWLRGADDESLLASRLRVAPDIRLDAASRPAEGGWQPLASALVVDSGFRWSLPCDEPTAALVAACDGDRPLATIVAVLAAATGVTGEELGPTVCATVRGLVDRGVLLP